MSRNTRNHRGLTLIEVLIVIAILLAIGGLVVVNLIPRKEQADIDVQKLQFQQIDAALKNFNAADPARRAARSDLSLFNSRSIFLRRDTCGLGAIARRDHFVEYSPISAPKSLDLMEEFISHT